jgi:biopolymer transport protein ExbB
LKEEIMIPLNTLGQVYHGGAVVPVLLNVINGSCSIERFFVISQAAGKTKWTLYDKDTSKLKQGEIDEAIVSCDKQQGSVANAIKSALVKYHEKKDSIVKKLQRLFTKKSKRLLHLRCRYKRI